METGKPYKGKIEEWTIVRVRGYEMILGFMDGFEKSIQTSYIMGWDGGLVETRNSVYALGRRAMIRPSDPVDMSTKMARKTQH